MHIASQVVHRNSQSTFRILEEHSQKLLKGTRHNWTLFSEYKAKIIVEERKVSEFIKTRGRESIAVNLDSIDPLKEDSSLDLREGKNPGETLSELTGLCDWNALVKKTHS